MELDTPSAQKKNAWFEPTRWSMVLAAAQTQAPGSRDALAELCRIYWRPLYSFARLRGCDHHRAEDLTQSFFLGLIETKTLSRADPLKGKFRNYLLAAFQNHMVNAHVHGNARKRGGGVDFVSIDAEAALQPVAPHSASAHPEAAFEREWALATVEAALARLEQDFVRRGKKDLFDTLQPFLNSDLPPATGEETAAKLNLSPGALRTCVHRLRAEFRTHLRREVARTVDTPDQIDDEMRHLRSILAARDR